jgi:hypothetical protein
MHRSLAAQMVTTVWQNLEKSSPDVSIDSYGVTSNHLHGIVALTKADRDRAAVPTSSLSLSTLVRRLKTFAAQYFRLDTGFVHQPAPRIHRTPA